MSKLSREQVLKLAKLSKLELTDEQVSRFQKELSAILAYFKRLETVDVRGLKPTYQVTGLENVMREDVVKKQQATPEALLKRTPRLKDNYIKTGRII